MNKAPDLFIRSLTRLLNNKVCFYAEKQYVSASFLCENRPFINKVIKSMAFLTIST